MGKDGRMKGGTLGKREGEREKESERTEWLEGGKKVASNRDDCSRLQHSGNDNKLDNQVYLFVPFNRSSSDSRRQKGVFRGGGQLRQRRGGR